MIELRALGDLRLRDSEDGREILSVLARAKPPGVLVYLALSPADVSHSRDKLLELLWPDSRTEKGRNSLSQALHILRSGLGPRVLGTTEDGELFLEAGALWSDVAAFDEALAAGHEREALELYRGHLWDGSDFSDCPAFERWLERERQRLRLKAVGAAVTLAQELERDGSFVDAAKRLRQARDWAPFDETVVQLLLKLLYRLGERDAAVREYEAYEERLAEVELTPSVEMSDFIEKIRSPAPGSPAAGSEPAVLAVIRAEPTDAASPTEAHRGGSAALASVTAQPRTSWRARGRAAAAIVVLGAITAAGATVMRNGRNDEPALDPTRVLVDVLQNETGDPALDPLGRMATDRVTAGLTYNGFVDVVSLGTQLLSLEPVVPDARSTERIGRLQALARANGTGTVVSGRYYLQNDSVHFLARVADAATGEELTIIEPIRGPVDAPLDAIEHLRDRVMTTLATLTDPRLARWMRNASKPPTFEAYQAFVRGIELHATDGNPRVAGAQFIRAAALDSTFTMPMLYATMTGGYTGPASDSIHQNLNRRRDQLAPLDRYLLDYLLARGRGDDWAALGHIRRLVEIAPNSAYLGLAAGIALRLRRPRLAIEFLRQGDPENWWRAPFLYWDQMAHAYHMLGDHRQQLEEVRRGQSQQTNPVFIRWQEINALAALGRTEQIEALFQESYWPRLGQSMANLAAELSAHGYGGAATEMLHRAVEWFEDRSPEQKRGLRDRRALAAVLLRVGRLDEAQVLFEGLVEDDGHDLRFGPRYLAQLGIVAARRGDRVEAYRLSRLLEVEDPLLNLIPSESAYARAVIAAALGERERAMALLRQSGAPLRSGLHGDPLVEPLWDYPPFQELLRPRG